MKKCQFCGEPGTNKEHILSHVVWERMEGGNAQLEVGVYDGATEGNFRPPHGQNAFVTKVACEKCNCGWMSDLENEFLTAVGSLVEPSWPILADAFMKEAVLQGTTLAKWLVKTTVTANAAGVIKRPIHPAIPRHLKEGMLPPPLAVLIGHIKEKTFRMQINRGFWFQEADEGKRWKGAEHNTSFDTLIQLNHLAMRVFCGPNLIFRYQTQARGRVIQCYPPGFGREPLNYSFNNLEEFEGVLLAKFETPLQNPPPVILLDNGK